jgi:pullulanase/glycogen debranching enzyme
MMTRQQRKDSLFGGSAGRVMSNHRASTFVLPFFAERDGVLDLWKEATTEIPEWHGALVAEWHARNFSSDEADVLNKRRLTFLSVGERYTALEVMSRDVEGVQDAS